MAFIYSFILQLEVLELLVQNGADLNAKNKHDETPAGKSHRLIFDALYLIYFHFFSWFMIHNAP